MVNINCSGEKIVVEFSGQSNVLNITNCSEDSISADMKFALEQFTNAQKKQAQYKNYTMTTADNKMPVKYHALNPSLFELSASKVAHYLFPDNFAEYKFIIKPDIYDIYAGYSPSSNQSSQCNDKKLEGVENVYATALYLGLEIRSHECITKGNQTYLYIDDFSHSFHKIDAKQGALMEEYRDHKISPFEEGTLFPSSFLNEKCGEWVNMACDIKKLKNAYEKIISTPKNETKSIIETAITVLQSIECQDSQDDSCKSDAHYAYMHYKAEVLVDNYESINDLLLGNSADLI